MYEYIFEYISWMYLGCFAYFRVLVHYIYFRVQCLFLCHQLKVQGK